MGRGARSDPTRPARPTALTTTPPGTPFQAAKRKGDRRGGPLDFLRVLASLTKRW